MGEEGLEPRAGLLPRGEAQGGDHGPAHGAGVGLLHGLPLRGRGVRGGLAAVPGQAVVAPVLGGEVAEEGFHHLRPPQRPEPLDRGHAHLHPRIPLEAGEDPEGGGPLALGEDPQDPPQHLPVGLRGEGGAERPRLPEVGAPLEDLRRRGAEVERGIVPLAPHEVERQQRRQVRATRGRRPLEELRLEARAALPGGEELAEGLPEGNGAGAAAELRGVLAEGGGEPPVAEHRLQGLRGPSPPEAEHEAEHVPGGAVLEERARVAGPLRGGDARKQGRRRGLPDLHDGLLGGGTGIGVRGGVEEDGDEVVEGAGVLPPRGAGPAEPLPEPGAGEGMGRVPSELPEEIPDVGVLAESLGEPPQEADGGGLLRVRGVHLRPGLHAVRQRGEGVAERLPGPRLAQVGEGEPGGPPYVLVGVRGEGEELLRRRIPREGAPEGAPPQPLDGGPPHPPGTVAEEPREDPRRGGPVEEPEPLGGGGPHGPGGIAGGLHEEGLEGRRLHGPQRPDEEGAPEPVRPRERRDGGGGRGWADARQHAPSLGGRPGGGGAGGLGHGPRHGRHAGRGAPPGPGESLGKGVGGEGAVLLSRDRTDRRRREEEEGRQEQERGQGPHGVILTGGEV